MPRRGASEVIPIDTEWEQRTIKREVPSRPSRRNAVATPHRAAWRRVLTVAGWAAATAAVLGLAIAAFQLEQFVRKDARFRLASPADIGEESTGISISGLQHASRQRISMLFERDYGRSILALPLSTRRDELRQLDWVKDASLRRVWPNQIRLELVERRPVAFTLVAGVEGVQHMLIDEEGVLLNVPAGASFSLPVLTGVRRDESRERRAERVRRMQQFLQETGKLAEKVSEIDLADLGNLKVIQPMEDYALTLYLGRAPFAGKLENLLRYYPEIRDRLNGARTLDLRVAGRINTVVESERGR